MVIAGIWVTVDVWRKTHRSRHPKFSPYRKRWYHWHYVSGIFFGIFVLTFTFSGMMSLADIPEWIHKPALKKGSATRMLHARAPQPEDYPLDYRRIIAAYPQALQIEWRNFREHPYYIVKDSKNEYYIDAADSLPRPLQLSEEEILKGVESIYTSQRDSSQHIPGIHISLLEHFETYYRDMSNYVSRTTPASRLEDSGGRPGPERLLHSPGNGNHPPCRHLLPLEILELYSPAPHASTGSELQCHPAQDSALGIAAWRYSRLHHGCGVKCELYKKKMLQETKIEKKVPTYSYSAIAV